MEIKDVQANQGKIDIVAEVVHKDESRSFEKFGKQGSVCNARIKDGSGEIVLTLWNEDVEKVKIGDKIHVENGWCSEYKGEKQLSAGKFGKIEIVEQSSSEVFTNSPEMLQKANVEQPTGDDDQVELFTDEEELVE